MPTREQGLTAGIVLIGMLGRREGTTVASDTERLDWLENNFWNGWSIGGSHQWEGGTATFWLEHKSGSPSYRGDDLRKLFDAAMAAEAGEDGDG